MGPFVQTVPQDLLCQSHSSSIEPRWIVYPHKWSALWSCPCVMILENLHPYIDSNLLLPVTGFEPWTLELKVRSAYLETILASKFKCKTNHNFFLFISRIFMQFLLVVTSFKPKIIYFKDSTGRSLMQSHWSKLENFCLWEPC